MEHRWGERFALHLTVQLSCTSLPPVAGSLENVSASGAFVRTAGPRPPRGPVEVMLQRRGSARTDLVRLAAYVVRETEAGVGLEWCEFAPRAVRELVVCDRRAGRARPRVRAQLSSRHSRESNTTTQALLESTTPSAAPPVLAISFDGIPMNNPATGFSEQTTGDYSAVNENVWAY